MFPADSQTHFDYQAVLVGIIAAIFTLLAGWNIYQMVDWNEKMRKLSALRKELDEQKSMSTEKLTYIHNKTDYCQAIVFGAMSQSAAVVFAPDNKEIIKQEMILKGLTAIKTLSGFPNTSIEIDSIIQTLIDGLHFSKHVSLKKGFITDMIMLCGEVKDKDKIVSFQELIKALEQCYPINNQLETNTDNA
ncbi:MAG: hypothetical protein JFR41_05760 [Muribaculaceae bacterium]|nr:hypothetical protein [Muribaculaceae bacterium]